MPDDLKTDVEENEEVVVEEAEAPKKPTGVLTTEFTQKGESVIVEITPVDEKDEKLQGKHLDVAFGELLSYRLQEDGSKTDEKIAGRFRVRYPRVIDGLEENLETMSPNAVKAVEMAVKQSGRGTAADYVIDADFESEFFKQKIETPKTDPNNVWTNDKFKDVRGELRQLGGEAESALEAASSSQVVTQSDFLDVAKVLKKMFELVNRSRPALASAVNGADGDSNHPLLKKFGSGPNALTEAMRLAELTEAEYDALPGSITSGKAVDRHRAEALKRLVDKPAVRAASGKEAITFPNEVNETPMPDADGASTILRYIALEAFGIETALDRDAVSLTDLIEEVNRIAAEKAAEYKVEYGKHVNTYDSTAYDYALRTYGRIVVSDGGRNMFAEAVGQLQVVAGLEGGEGEDAKKYLGELGALFNKNLMMKYALAAGYAHQSKVKRETQNRQLMKQVEDDEGPITKGTVKGFGGLNALAAAAHLYKLLNTRKDAAVVWDNMRSLVAQTPLTGPQEEKKGGEDH